MKQMVGGCCVCSDERGWAENPLVYCDGRGCNVAVHQACYGIVSVPSGPWYCRKCESQERAARVRCELCPQKDGALKRTESGGWCHVVCALYIPEAWFANVHTMEPIVLKSVPQDRFSKVCYICEEKRGEGTKNCSGACMQCNKTGCRQFFHVTCAQGQGLLCEESGNMDDNVKYCGYCVYHYKKLKKDAHIKTIPAFKPIPAENATPDSTPEKEAVGPPKLDKEKKTPRSGVGSGDGAIAVSTLHTQCEVSRSQSFLQTTLSSSNTADSISSSALQSPALNTREGRKVAVDSADDRPESSRDKKPGPLGSGGAVPGHGEGAVSSDNVTLADCVQGESNHGHQETTATTSQNLFAPQTHSNASSISGVFGSMTVAESAGGAGQLLTQDGSFPSVSGALNSSGGATGLSALLSAPLASLSSAQASVTPDVTGVKRQRTKLPQDKKQKPRNAGCAGKTKNGRRSQNGGGRNVNVIQGTGIGHNYASSVFGGGPCFQSPVSLTSFSSPAFESSSLRLGSYRRSWYNSRDFTVSWDEGEAVNGSSFPPPPKLFPSQNNNGAHESCGGVATSMAEFLEQQWDHAAQFLMEQAQHLDVATLLNQMHELVAENERLEEQVKALKSHRDHLLSTNSRLATPFSLTDEIVELSAPDSLQRVPESDPPGRPRHPVHLAMPSLPPVEPINCHDQTISVALPLRTTDPSCVDQVSCLTTSTSSQDPPVLQVMPPVLQPPSLQPSIPAFKQLPPASGARASNARPKDKT